MWNHDRKRSALRDHMVLTAPEVNPHEFVRRYLRSHSAPAPKPVPKARRDRLDSSSADTIPISV